MHFFSFTELGMSWSKSTLAPVHLDQKKTGTEKNCETFHGFSAAQRRETIPSREPRKVNKLNLLHL